MNGSITQELDTAVARQGNAYRWHGQHRAAVDRRPLWAAAVGVVLMASVVVPATADSAEPQAQPRPPEPPASEPEPDHGDGGDPLDTNDPEVEAAIERRAAAPAARHRRDDPLPNPPLEPRPVPKRVTSKPVKVQPPAAPEPPQEPEEPTGGGSDGGAPPGGPTAEPDVPDVPPGSTDNGDGDDGEDQEEGPGACADRPGLQRLDVRAGGGRARGLQPVPGRVG